MTGKRTAARKTALPPKPRATAAKALPTRRTTATTVDLQDTIGLSIRQPYAEEILRGLKRKEYRSRTTKIRGRVLIYASLQPGDPRRFAKLGLDPGDLPTGLVVGSVEIMGCKGTPGEYEWYLANPRRIKQPLPPKNRPQPGWFYPFRRGKPV